MAALLFVCVCVCMRACVRACVLACVHACVRACVCLYAPMCGCGSGSVNFVLSSCGIFRIIIV